MSEKNLNIALTDGRKLAYAEYGCPGGFPIIYCHGSQSSRLEMHYDLSFAEENNLRIITVDRPGHGLSDFNTHGRIISFAEDIRLLIDHLRIVTFSVAGMSAGAPFALALAHQLPERVKKVAIISGFAPFTKENAKHLGREVKTLLTLAKNAPFLLRLMLKIQAKKMAKKPNQALDGFLKMMSAPDQKILARPEVKKTMSAMFQEAFRKGSRGIAYEISRLLITDWGFLLNDITVPVTIWQGKQDNNIPHQWASLMTKELPNSQLKLIENGGHLIIFEHASPIFTDLK